MKFSEALEGRAPPQMHYVIARLALGSVGTMDQQFHRVWDAVSNAAARIGNSKQLFAFGFDRYWFRGIVGVENASAVRWMLRAISDEYAALVISDFSGSLFGDIKSIRIQGGRTQLAVLRHCHMAPTQLGYVAHLDDWRWSSHRAYVGMEHMTGLKRGWMAALSADGPGGWPLAYSCLTSNVKSNRDAILLPNLLEIPILPNADNDGDERCLAALRQVPSPAGPEQVFRQAVDEVCAITGCDPDQFMARPSERTFRLERALLLDRVMTAKGVRSLTGDQLASRLNCDRSALYHTRKEICCQYPDLFQRGGARPSGITSNDLVREPVRDRASSGILAPDVPADILAERDLAVC